MNQTCDGGTKLITTLSLEEKQGYCESFERSGLSKAEFCRAQNIKVTDFYYWYKQFRKQTSKADNSFLPLMVKPTDSLMDKPTVQLEIKLANQIQVVLSMGEAGVIPFIQELSCAVTTIR